jgi:predicted nucleotidyltransferase
MPALTLRKPDKEILFRRKTVLFEKTKQVGEYLRGLGAKEVYVFGSITRDDYHFHSDVDMAVSGLPHQYIYTVEARIADILGTDNFDLVYLEYTKERVKNRILEQGVKLC